MKLRRRKGKVTCPLCGTENVSFLPNADVDRFITVMQSVVSRRRTDVEIIGREGETEAEARRYGSHISIPSTKRNIGSSLPLAPRLPSGFLYR